MSMTTPTRDEVLKLIESLEMFASALVCGLDGTQKEIDEQKLLTQSWRAAATLRAFIAAGDGDEAPPPDYRTIAKNLSEALRKVRPLGGSEIFRQFGSDEYFADAEICGAIIEQMHKDLHNARLENAKLRKPALAAPAPPQEPTEAEVEAAMDSFAKQPANGMTGYIIVKERVRAALIAAQKARE